MTAKTHINTLRKAAKSAQGLTFGQITTLCELLASGDLIHVDEVRDYVAQAREEDPEFCVTRADAAADAGVWA